MMESGESTAVDESEVSSRTPAYISFKSFLTFIEDQKEHGLPTEIDRSVLTRFSGSVSGQLIAALKFLRLIDDEQVVQDELQALVDAYGTERWQATLAQLVRRSYAPIVGEDLTRLTPAKFHEVFKSNYPAKDAVIRKCEVFFLKAAEAAAIEVNPRIAKHRASRQSGAGRRSTGKAGREASNGDSQRNGAGRSEQQDPPAATVQTPAAMLFDLLDPDEMDEDEQSAVFTLMRYLKRRDADE